jgi:arylsulfatase A
MVASVGSGQGQDKPNIVLILADDLGINDLQCYGRTEHKTPHLDALAQSGIRYTNGYCGLSICSASRVALMTGKSPARLHLTSYLPGRPDAPSQRVLNAKMHSAMPPEERTIAEELKKVGYRTGLFGKWHLGGGESSPGKQGFDVVLEAPAKGKLDETEGGKNEFLISRKAIDFIQESKDGPFFCYIPQHQPHIKLEATEEAMKRHEGTFSPLYAANIESMDRAVGMVLDAVQKLATERDTILIFSSDNGGLHVPELHTEPVTHNRPFRAGKGYLYEGGVRVPFLVTSIKGRFGKDRVVEEAVSLIDLYPTLLKLAGVDVPKTIGPVDGIDISANWVDSRRLDSERTLFWHFPHYTNQGSRPTSAIRQGNWKLVQSLEDQSVELYDLSNDIGEENNLADTNRERAAQLTKRLSDWRISVGAQMCQANPNWVPDQSQSIYQTFDSTKLKADKSAMAIGEFWKPWRDAMNGAIKDLKPQLKSPEGTLTLWATQAQVHGKKIRYEPEPNKNVLGYWTEVDDWAHWEFDVPTDGIYEIEVQCGCGQGHGGSTAAISCQDQRLEWTVRDTGHFQNMIYESLGEMKLTAGKSKLEVRPKTKANVAVMDIRKIVLRKK